MCPLLWVHYKEDCAFENRIKDDIKRYFGKDASEFIDDGLKIDRKVELYEHQVISLQEIQKRREAGIKAFLIVLPTAAGKSKIVEEDLREFARNKLDFKGLILVPGVNILLDWADRIKTSLPEIKDKIEIRTYAYMAIMLRPTQSPIVFIQQLGRGLRKANGKEYVVILDFIGNYNNNFMIPIALSGDRTYNKDNIRRYIMEGGRIIPGASTVHFDEISRKKIFASVDNANFSDIKLIRENYTNLKNKLGRIPRLRDFDDYGEMDVLRIFDNNSLGSYYKFLVKYEKEYKVRLSEDEEKVIEFVSKKLASGKRIQELKMLKRMLAYAHGLSQTGLFAGLSEDMKEYGKNISQDQKENIVNVMTNEFPAGASKKTYSQCVFIEEEGTDYKPTKSFMQMMSDNEFYDVLQELVEFGISRYERDYKNTYDQTDLVLYQKYTYEDVCRLLNWEQNEVPLNIGGYKFDKKTKTFPVFINYDKSEDISDTTKYEDHFVPGFRDRLIAISKSGRSLQSEDVQNFLKAKERGIRVELFVRKNKDDKVSKEFYYLGHMTASGNTKEFTMANTAKTAVEIEWILDVPVREDIYEYIVNS